MDLIIHCYGYSELIFHVLQGIAMFRESKFYVVVIETMVLMVGLFYATQMSASRQEGQWRQYLLKGFGTIIFVNSLLLPKTSMLIKDHVEKNFWKVDNVPLAFALPIGAVESFGHVLTMGFEQVFSLVGSKSSLMYYHYGTVFGARLSKEVLEAKIRDPEVVGNMRHFIERCVMLPAMIGHKFTKEELVTTDDIWGLVSKNAGTLTRTDMYINGLRQHPSPTCKEAVAYFEAKFASQSSGLINALSSKFRGAGTEAKYNPGIRQLNKSISAAIAGLYGGGHKVDTILKNNMMINSINSYRSGKYATARAQMHQEAGGLLSGDMAEKTLTGSLALMKVIVYGSFIFLLPLLILAGGIQKYKSWIVMVFSLSLWPPLFSMLNMVIDFAYDPAKVVSYSTWSTEVQKFDSIASLAACLTMSIPFLAYGMARMGEGAFTHLAGTIMASSNAASSAIAGEKSSGSRAWDNDNINNASRDISNSSKTNHNMEYVTGEQSWNNTDGARVKMAATGQQIITGGAGITADVGETRYSIEDSRRGEVNEGAQRSEEMLAADSRTYSTAKSNTFAKTKDWIKNLAQREAGGETINYESMGEQGKNVQQMVSTAKTLAKDYGYSYDQAAEGSLTGGINASSPFKSIVGGVSVGADGRITARNSSNQQFSEKEQTDRNSQLAENYNNVIKAAKNQSHSTDQTIDKSQSTRVSSAYEEQERAEAALSQSRHVADSWHQAQNIINSSGGISSKDMTKDVIDRYMQDSGITDRNVAHKHVSDRSPAVMRTWNKMLSEDNYVQNLVADIASTKANVSSSAGNKTLNNFSDQHQLTAGSNDYKVDRVASEDGFNGQKIEQGINRQKQGLTQNYSAMNSDNHDQHEGVGYGIKTGQQGLQAKIDKYEEDRMGQGAFAEKLSNLSYIRGIGNLVDPVGGPQKDTTHIPSMNSQVNNNINPTEVSGGTKTSGKKNSHDDLSDLAPNWIQYTGDKSSENGTGHAKHFDLGNYTSRFKSELKGQLQKGGDGQRANQNLVKVSDKE